MVRVPLIWRHRSISSRLPTHHIIVHTRPTLFLRPYLVHMSTNFFDEPLLFCFFLRIEIEVGSGGLGGVFVEGVHTIIIVIVQLFLPALGLAVPEADLLGDFDADFSGEVRHFRQRTARLLTVEVLLLSQVHGAAAAVLGV